MPTLMLPKDFETKNFGCEIKSIDADQGRISGYLAVFNNIDSQKDRILPGAFSKTISEAYSRKEKQNRKYLIPLLWMHDPEKPLGGYTELREDKVGLYFEADIDINTTANGFPLNQLAMAAFSGCKMGYNDEQSIGYMPIRKEYDDQGIRNLKEIQLFEGSLITQNFASNSDALLTGVKSNAVDLELKATICGDTSLPIGPRDEAWDGSKAKSQIFEYAATDDGLDASKCRKCFLVLDGDPNFKGSWGYPFCYVKNGSPMISVGGVKACVGAASGSRNASPPDGIRGKLETLYTKINSKYPDATPLVPPWKDDGKRGQKPVETKDFNDRYRMEQIWNWMRDLDGWYAAIRKALMDIFLIGDTPQTDLLDTILNTSQDNKTGAIAALEEWVQRGVNLDVSNYLQDDEDDDNMTLYQYMRRNPFMDTKAGRAFSQANQDALNEHVKSLKDMATEHKSMSDQLAAQYKSMVGAMNEHCKSINNIADDISSVIGRPAYDGEDQSEQQNAANGKSRTIPFTPPVQAPEQHSAVHSPPTSTNAEDLNIDDFAQLIA